MAFKLTLKHDIKCKKIIELQSCEAFEFFQNLSKRAVLITSPSAEVILEIPITSTKSKYDDTSQPQLLPQYHTQNLQKMKKE